RLDASAFQPSRRSVAEHSLAPLLLFRIGVQRDTSSNHDPTLSLPRRGRGFFRKVDGSARDTLMIPIAIAITVQMSSSGNPDIACGMMRRSRLLQLHDRS